MNKKMAKQLGTKIIKSKQKQKQQNWLPINGQAKKCVINHSLTPCELSK